MRTLQFELATRYLTAAKLEVSELDYHAAHGDRFGRKQESSRTK